MWHTVGVLYVYREDAWLALFSSITLQRDLVHSRPSLNILFSPLSLFGEMTIELFQTSLGIGKFMLIYSRPFPISPLCFLSRASLSSLGWSPTHDLCALVFQVLTSRHTPPCQLQFLYPSVCATRLLRHHGSDPVSLAQLSWCHRCNWVSTKRTIGGW